MGKIRTKRGGRGAVPTSTSSTPNSVAERRKAKLNKIEMPDVWHPDSLKLTPLDKTEEEIFSKPSLILKPSMVTGPIGSGVDSYVVTAAPAFTPKLPTLSLLDDDEEDSNNNNNTDADGIPLPRPKVLSKRQHQITDVITKNGRRLQRREQFIQKLEGLHKSKRKHQMIAKKKANPPALVGDLTELQSELEAIGGRKKASKAMVPDGLAKKTLTTMKTADKKATQRVTSKRGRQHTLMMEANNFKNVLSNAQFKINPAATVKTHLKNSLVADRKIVDALGLAMGSSVPRKAAAAMKKTKPKVSKQPKKTERKKSFKVAVGASAKSGTNVTTAFATGMRKMGKIGKKGRLTMSMKNPKLRKALKHVLV